jgi:hypothetical protein
MTDFLMTADGDLDVSGGLSLTSSLVESTAQRLRIKFRFFEGEGLLDPRSGIPYYDKILVKNPNLAEIKRLFHTVLLADPAVESVESIDLEYSRSGRSLAVTFSATLNDGSNLTFEDFILPDNA